MEGGKNEDEDEDSDELDGEKKELPKKNIVINGVILMITFLTQSPAVISCGVLNYYKKI